MSQTYDSSAQGDVLSVLTHTPAETVKAFTEALLNELGSVTVLTNRTGLVMLPYRDSAKGARFHLGEALVSEAHVRLAEHGSEGYAACLGRDLEQSLAVAILDAALQAGVMEAHIMPFVQEQAARLEAEDELFFRQVEATRVEMETF